MADAKLILKKDLKKEPEYTGSDNDSGSGTQSCPNKKEDPIQKISSVVFKDSKGKTIDKIEKEEEVELEIETEQMAGEEVVLNIGAMGGNLTFMDEPVTPNHVLVVKINGNKEKIKFKVESKRLAGYDN